MLLHDIYSIIGTIKSDSEQSYGSIMGMFDLIYTNYRLPDIEVSEDLTLIFNSGNTRHFGYETEFQTKDLNCVLDKYLITSHGRLILTGGKVNQDTSFHGKITFYTTVKRPLGGGYFIEYHAKFTDGKLIEIGGECIRAYG